MDIIMGVFSTFKELFRGSEYERCHTCGYFPIPSSIIWFRDQVYYFMRRKYYRHVFHTYWRIIEKHYESIANLVYQVWPTVFFFAIVSFISYMIWTHHKQRNAMRAVGGPWRKQFRDQNQTYENCYKYVVVTEESDLGETFTCTVGGSGERVKFYLLEKCPSHCSNFHPKVHYEDSGTVTFGGSNHSNSEFKFAIGNDRTSSHNAGSSQEFEGDVLNETVPVNRMRRESVCAEAYDPEEDLRLKNYQLHAKTESQQTFLLDTIRVIFPFNLLDNDQLELVTGAMFKRTVSKGEVLICEGDTGDFFYVIERGRYVVSVFRDNEEKILKVYHDKGSFGELALLYNTRRAATVSAAVDGVVWCLDRLTFKSVVARTAHQRRIMNESLLRRLPLLNHLPAGDILSLSDALVRRSFDDGELIIHQGGVPDGMYFIRKGEVRVCVLDEFEKEKELKILTVGDYFGERALITRGRREASVYAKGVVELEYLNLDAFERLLGPCVDLFKERIALQDQGMDLLKN